MIEKIISGGQTGADQATLDAAITLGIPHVGYTENCGMNRIYIPANRTVDWKQFLPDPNKLRDRKVST